MVVDGNHISYDLSRFSGCVIKRAALCDLMQIPEFVDALNAETKFDVGDDWVANIALELKMLYRTPQAMKTNLSDEQIAERIRRQNLARHVVQQYRKLGYYEH